MAEKLLTWLDILTDTITTPIIPQEHYTKDSWVHGWMEEERFTALAKYYNENPDAVNNPAKFRRDNPIPGYNKPLKKWYHKILGM